MRLTCECASRHPVKLSVTGLTAYSEYHHRNWIEFGGATYTSCQEFVWLTVRTSVFI